MTRLLTTLIAFTLATSVTSQAQVTGGTSVFSGMSLSNSPLTTALGGMSAANPSGDINLALQNPALLQLSNHHQLSINHFNYYAQTALSNLAYARYYKPWKTMIGAAVQYNNYGQMQSTDEYGNITGEVFARDYSLTLTGSRQYNNRWRYGANCKFIGANYAQQSSYAIAFDFGVYYDDTSKLLTLGMVAKNIGTQLSKFNAANPAEPLPFDFQIGFSKRFQHLPFRFQATLHHLYTWDIRYNNPLDVSTSTLFIGQQTKTNKDYTADKFFDILFLQEKMLLGKNISLIISYNHLRRAELANSKAKGLSGFAGGLNLKYKKWQLVYAKSFYNQVGGTINIGINLFLDKM